MGWIRIKISFVVTATVDSGAKEPRASAKIWKFVELITIEFVERVT